MPTAAFHPSDRASHQAWADDFEARAIGSHRTTTGEVLCAHNWVTDAVKRDPTLDNNVVQAEGQAACIAAQIAARNTAEEAEK